MTKIKKSCRLNINSKEWFQARCNEVNRRLVNEVPLSKKLEAKKACSNPNGNSFCRVNSSDEKDKEVKKAANDIENRPKELWGLPDYGCLPNRSSGVTE